MSLNIEQVTHHLQNVLSGQNDLIKQSSQELKKYLKDVSAISTLSFILKECNQPQFRQLAAVLLKKCLPKLYDQLNEQHKQEFQTLILQRFFLEPQEMVRRNISYLIGKVANEQFAEQKPWNQLLDSIKEYTDENKALVERQKGFELLNITCEYAGDSMNSFYESFFEFFRTSINDKDFKIAYLTARCFLNILEHIFEEKMQKTYCQLLPQAFQILKLCIEKLEGQKGFELLDQLQVLIENGLLQNQCSYVVEICCEVLIQKNIEYDILLGCIDLLTACCEQNKKQISKQNELIKKIIQSMTYIIQLPVKKNEIDEEQEPIQDIALVQLGNISSHLSKKKVFPILFEMINYLITVSQYTNEINSGFLILSRATDILPHEINKKTETIVKKFIPIGLNHQDPTVVGSCIQSLSYLADALQEDLTKYHSIVFQKIIDNYNSLNWKISEKALFCIDLFCDSLQEELLPYLPKLIDLLVQIPLKNDPKITILMRKAAISATGSCINSLTLQQFGEQNLTIVWKMFNHILTCNNNVEVLGLKAESLNAIGKFIAKSNSNLQFYNLYITPLLQQVLQLIQLDDYEIREGCLSFFYNFSLQYAREFNPYFDQLIDFVFKEVNNQDLITKPKQSNKDFSLGSDSEDESLAGEGMVNINQIMVEEKSAALQALGNFAQACPIKFVPYFERAFSDLQDLYSFVHENIRKQAFICNRNLFLAYIKSKNNGELPAFQKGDLSAKYNDEIGFVLQNHCLNNLLTGIKSNDNDETVAFCIDQLTELLLKLGTAFIFNNYDIIFDVIQTILENQLLAQNKGCEQDFDDDEDEETNVYIFESCIDLISAVAKVCKQGISIHFAKIFPSMMQYLLPVKGMDDNCSMLGCFADVFNKVKSSQFIQFYQKEVLNSLQGCLQYQDDEVNRNLAFLLNVMVRHSFDSMKQFLPTVKKTLTDMYMNAQLKQTKENIIMSICIVFQYSKDFSELDQCLKQLFIQCPFIEDQAENKNAIKFLLDISKEQGQILLKYLIQVLDVMVSALQHLSAYKIKSSLEQQIILFIKQLMATNQGDIERRVLQIADPQMQQIVINKLKLSSANNLREQQRRKETELNMDLIKQLGNYEYEKKPKTKGTIKVKKNTKLPKIQKNQTMVEIQSSTQAIQQTSRKSQASFMIKNKEQVQKQQYIQKSQTSRLKNIQISQQADQVNKPDLVQNQILITKQPDQELNNSFSDIDQEYQRIKQLTGQISSGSFHSDDINQYLKQDRNINELKYYLNEANTNLQQLNIEAQTIEQLLTETQESLAKSYLYE